MKLYCDHKNIEVYFRAVAIFLATAFGSMLFFAPWHFSEASSGYHLSQLDALNQVAEDSGLVSEGGTAVDQPLTVLLGRVINPLLVVIGTLFLLLIIYAGLTWMTAAGNEERAGRARKILTTAAVGLALVIGAYTITRLVINRVLESTKTEQANVGVCVYDTTVNENCDAGKACTLTSPDICTAYQNSSFYSNISDCKDICPYQSSGF